MFGNKAQETTRNLVDQAANGADTAIRSTQRVANGALESLAESVSDLRDHAAPALNRASEQAAAYAEQLRNRAVRVSDNTVGYVRDEPVKSILIAALAGAALMALVSLLGSSRDRV